MNKFILSLVLMSTSFLFANTDKLPNIVYIYADDLGYGDVSCLNPNGLISTPSIDKVAQQGMIFTDCHSSASVCTPSRYSLMTGRYSWRSSLKKGVLTGYKKAIIEDGRMTVASLLKENGYNTAMIGKWHLGMNWALNSKNNKKIDYSRAIKKTPTSNGFDYFYGISASLDFPPYIYIENDRAVGEPTEHIDLSFNQGIDRHGRPGPIEPKFKVNNVLTELTQKTTAKISELSKQEKPFFLYFSLTSPHTPCAPADEFIGKSSLGLYGDFVMETDYRIGQVIKAIKDNDIEHNTLVIISSDNGCATYIGHEAFQTKGHYPSYIFRGYKGSLFEGGHRVPYIVKWPAKVKAGALNDTPVSQVGFLATCAEIVGAELPDNAGEDSVSNLPAMLSLNKKPIWESFIHKNGRGGLAIRHNEWKLILTKVPALYNLKNDIKEQKNLALQYPEIVSRLTKLLQKYVDDGRSTPGEKQQNTTPVDIYMGHTPRKKKK
ncbi:arylsulfatase A precursor [Lentisphaera araneosa HTCC2155]|uniref:Arylsulfatase A n=1 Tax=Lentisphaera araneosa HTCC2155 TaxID=313628 RepID=A6DQE3_9BACT|nr:arylsulfatase [Lentisphaera araneosa]EDM26194.1 arylsulfatase A precursor [Lentisphaera araneosa HTCC2155]